MEMVKFGMGRKLYVFVAACAGGMETSRWSASATQPRFSLAHEPAYTRHVDPGENGAVHGCLRGRERVHIYRIDGGSCGL